MDEANGARTGRMTRVLDEHPVETLADYRAMGGLAALADAWAVEPDVIISLITDSGLRGRGGAGFPTGIKWRTVAEDRSSVEPTSVVVNAAEGEPGTFKDRAILRANPYRVLEGAQIAARAVGAQAVVVAVKHSFDREAARLAAAIAEMEAAGIDHLLPMRVVRGPSEYLFGEESALLEVVEGRPPFPRVTPPYRRGLDEDEPWARNPSSTVHLAGEGGTDESPALVDNVETMANVPGIVANGVDWFRSVGTEKSPGTVVCTVSGCTRRAGVGEYAMGTSLSQVIAELGGGARPGQTIVAVLPGAASAAITTADLDVPLAYETFGALGSGLGSAGFIVLDDSVDLVSVAHGVSRFLAVESCGQCEPCKLDGLEIARRLDAVRRSDGSPSDLEHIRARLGTVANGARCALAREHEASVGSLVALAAESADRHVQRTVGASGKFLIAPLLDIDGGVAVLDLNEADKLPDWEFGGIDSGKVPAARYENQPVDALPSFHRHR